MELTPYPEKAEALHAHRGLWKPSSAFGWEELRTKRRKTSLAGKHSVITTDADKVVAEFPS